jgi:hypothetical protein
VALGLRLFDPVAACVLVKEGVNEKLGRVFDADGLADTVADQETDATMLGDGSSWKSKAYMAPCDALPETPCSKCMYVRQTNEDNRQHHKSNLSYRPWGTRKTMCPIRRQRHRPSKPARSGGRH